MTSSTLPTVTPFKRTGLPETRPEAESKRVSYGHFFLKRLARRPTMKMPSITATSAMRTTIPTRNRRPTWGSLTMASLDYSRNGRRAARRGSGNRREGPRAAGEPHRPEVLLQDRMASPGRLIERADELETPLVEECDPGGHGPRGHDVVGHDDGRRLQPDVQVDDELGDLLGSHGVESRRRLVVEDDLRLEGDRAREGHALPHAARELRGHLPLDAGQVDHVQLLGDRRRDFLRRLAGVLLQREGHVLLDVHRVEERASLEEHRDAAADGGELFLGEPHDGLSEDQDV